MPSSNFYKRSKNKNTKSIIYLTFFTNLSSFDQCHNFYEIKHMEVIEIYKRFAHNFLEVGCFLCLYICNRLSLRKKPLCLSLYVVSMLNEFVTTATYQTENKTLIRLFLQLKKWNNLFFIFIVLSSRRNDLIVWSVCQ